MTEDDIINSQAFKAINVLVDQKAEDLKGYMVSLQDKVDRMFRKHEYQPYVTTRIHAENPSHREDRDFALPAHVHEVKELQFYLDTILRLDNEISDLFRFKCRLTGDWDFTKGDMTEMIAVFGEKIS